MKRQFYFTPQEIDLLSTSLEMWHEHLKPANSQYMTLLQRAAGEYAQRRINEMLDRLAGHES